MRRKKFETMIFEHYQNLVPDVSKKIDLQSIDIIEPQLRNRFSLKSLFTVSRLLRTSLLAFLVIISYSLFFKNPGTIATTVFAEVHDIYAFQAISSTDLLVQTLAEAETNPLSLSFSMNLANPVSSVENELSVLNKYMNMMEQFLGNNNGLSAEVAISTLAGYEKQMTYHTVNLLGETIDYIFYYNEAEGTEAQIASEAFNFSDENDSDITQVISGMMLIKGIEYRMEGKHFTSDDEETIILRSFTDNLNYVTVKYQIDDDGDKKFFYDVVKNGIVINRSKVKVETEDDKVVTELSFIEGTAKGVYVFKQESDGFTTYISVRYEIIDADGLKESGSIRIIAILDPLTGLTSYTYNVKSDDGDYEDVYHGDREDDMDDEDEEDEQDEEDEDDSENEDDPDEDDEQDEEDD